MVIIFVNLGCWQLHRAEEKNHMLVQHAQLAKLGPMVWHESLPLKQYERVSVNGVFLAATILLDNQFYKHQFGYNVLTPLYLTSGKIVLVDRGWIKGDPSRRQWPRLTTPSKPVNITGRVYFPSKTWVLGPEYEQKAQDFVIIERINTQLLAELLHKFVYPFIIRLDPKVSYGYVRKWPVIAMSPARHYAYAVQWFMFALLSLVLGIIYKMKRD